LGEGVGEKGGGDGEAWGGAGVAGGSARQRGHHRDGGRQTVAIVGRIDCV
jgi:hypothetical protein